VGDELKKRGRGKEKAWEKGALRSRVGKDWEPTL